MLIVEDTILISLSVAYFGNPLRSADSTRRGIVSATNINLVGRKVCSGTQHFLCSRHS